MSDSVVPVRVEAATTARQDIGPRWAVVEGHADRARWQTVISARLARFLGVKPIRLRGKWASAFAPLKRGAEALVFAEAVDFAHDPRPLVVSIDDAAATAGGAEVILGRDYLDPIRIPIYGEVRWGSDGLSAVPRRRRTPQSSRITEILRETVDAINAHRRRAARKGQR